jgi:hypothetical protein
MHLDQRIRAWTVTVTNKGDDWKLPRATGKGLITRVAIGISRKEYGLSARLSAHRFVFASNRLGKEPVLISKVLITVV